jgi:hypothetical protein
MGLHLKFMLSVIFVLVTLHVDLGGKRIIFALTSSTEGYDLPIYPTSSSLPSFDDYLVFMNEVIKQAAGGTSTANVDSSSSNATKNAALEKHDSNVKKGSYAALRTGQQIPRILWIAMTDVSEGLNYQLPELFNRNPTWSVQVHVFPSCFHVYYVNYYCYSISHLSKYRMSYQYYLHLSLYS